MSIGPLNGGTADQLQTIDYTGLWKLTMFLYANTPGAFILDGLPAEAYCTGPVAPGGEALSGQYSFGGSMLVDRPVLMKGKMNLRIASSAQIIVLLIREWITWED